MDIGDKSWMNLPRRSPGFIDGVNDFLDKAFERASQGNEILCPCKKCFNRSWHYRNIVENHLFDFGFVRGYTKWVFHGEGFSSNNKPQPTNDGETSDMHDDIDKLLDNTFKNVEDDRQYEGVKEGPSEDAKKFFRLVEDGKQELYPGCKSFSKLSFTIRLFLLKSIHGLSNAAFSDLIDLLKKAFPFAQIPESFHKARKVVKDLGLNYEKIHACPNDCMLFWNDNANIDNCSICGSSRWKNVHDDLTNQATKVPAKILRYFPLKPRLQRIFMCSETSVAMRWHATERPNDGNLRHPADGQAWQDFDSLHSDFSKDVRNVRLGLSSDGFNPFRTMSISHSTWPVILMNYNLAPWNCMQSEHMMLSMIIPGPSSPGNDIDVYLQPLIAELKELWEVGVETYDVVTNQTFVLRAALLWTISDFPAMAMLSGWSTKGRWACPICNYDTCSQYLKHSRKMCYLGHRAFLPSDHPFRRDKKAFDGNEEHKAAPTPLSDVQVLEELQEFSNVFGKSQKKRKQKNDGPWKKKSIFFELPYWVHNKLRHNLDVMHIEKNICDSLLGTLLDIPGKSKDHVNSRYDLQEMGIRKELQPVKDDNSGKVYLAKACFSMNSEEKKLFCTVLKHAKLPKGVCSNISSRVQMDELKISGYKSHDAHFIMHYLLQIAVRKTLRKNVSLVLIRLGNFFRAICSKVIKRCDLVKLKDEIVDIECHLEKIFPPSFFDIMTHLPIHLVNEIELGGPVHLRWMYPSEREMCKFKGFVRNRGNPEASIAESWLAEECLTFCSRYLHDEDIPTDGDDSSKIFPKIGHRIGGKKKNEDGTFDVPHHVKFEAHRYILFNTGDEQVETFIKEHKNLIDNHRRGSAWVKAQIHSREFSDWFEEKVRSIGLVSDQLRWLSKGPSVATRYTGYSINGYRFYTVARDSKLKTQNSGVTLSATTDSFASVRDQNPVDGMVIYYGVIQEILEIDYWGCFCVVIFRCDWFHNEVDEFGLTRVYFNKKCSTDDPFVLASQVHQVFYLEDPIEKKVYYARNKVPVDLEEENYLNIEKTYWREPDDDIGPSERSLDVDVRWSREELPVDIVNDPFPAQLSQDDTSEEENEFDDTDWDYMEADD